LCNTEERAAVLTIALVAVPAFVAGLWVGGRLMLARQRIRSLGWVKDMATNAGSAESALLQSIRLRELLKGQGDVHRLRVTNLQQFVLLWNWDLTTILSDLRTEGTDWSFKGSFRRKLHARLLALTAYESLRNLDRLLDPGSQRKWAIATSLRVLGASSDVQNAFYRAHTAVLEKLAAHDTLLVGIRKNIIAHRDQDVSVQLSWFKRAKSDELEELGWELLTLTTDLIGTLAAFSREQAIRQGATVA
jgi:hypothetical protein